MFKQFLLAATLIAMPVAGFSAFQLHFNTAAATAETMGLGDLSNMLTVVNDALAIADKGDLTAAEKRITDFETLWDEAEPTLRPKNKDQWSNIDGASDGALKSLRAKTPDPLKVKAKLSALSAVLADPSKPVE
jgi:hypothetical protein